MWLWPGTAPSARRGSGEQTALSPRLANLPLPYIKQGLDADLSLTFFHASPNRVPLYPASRRHNEVES